MNQNKLLLLTVFTLIISVLLSSCKDDDTTEPQARDAQITGIVMFLDGTLGISAQIELHNISTNARSYSTADENGIYTFDSLYQGSYKVKFRSTNQNINSFEKDINLSSSQQIEQNIYITYNMLDDLNVATNDSSMFFIKYQADGAKIGTNFDSIEYLIGTYFGDYYNQSVLSCDIYKNPDTLNWSDAIVNLTSEYVRDNFEFLVSVDESFQNGRHELRFEGETIPIILSNPAGGFAFLRRENVSRTLKIPCVDFNNNDFGLRIIYK